MSETKPERTERTPETLKLDGKISIVTDEGKSVATIYPQTHLSSQDSSKMMRAIASQIVLTWNSHASLTAENERLVEENGKFKDVNGELERVIKYQVEVLETYERRFGLDALPKQILHGLREALRTVGEVKP